MEYSGGKIFEFNEENKNILNLDYEIGVVKKKIICYNQKRLSIKKINLEILL
jgi:hypothetical protein